MVNLFRHYPNYSMSNSIPASLVIRYIPHHHSILIIYPSIHPSIHQSIHPSYCRSFLQPSRHSLLPKKKPALLTRFQLGLEVMTWRVVLEPRMHGKNTQFTGGFHQRNIGISQVLTIKHDWKMGKKMEKTDLEPGIQWIRFTLTNRFVG